jgi:hypothetical protein
MLGAGVSQGSMGLAIVQVSQTPVCIPSMLDPVSGHIPVKIKETIWAGEYVDLNILLKSAKDLVSDSHLNGDLTVKGGLHFHALLLFSSNFSSFRCRLLSPWTSC